MKDLLSGTPYDFFYEKPGEVSPLDKEFQDGYLLFDNTLLPKDYIESSRRLYLMGERFGGGHKVCGGVLIVESREYFRTVALSPKKFKPSPFSVEMNGLWLNPDTPPRIRFAFWAKVVEALSQLPVCADVFFSYETHKKGLDNFYKILPGATVYEGPVEAISGMKSDQVERIVRMSIRDFFSGGLPERMLLQKATAALEREKL